ncbi:MAG: TlpA family protein disulfide reductase [Saprospiraceae bacterium]|nr:TlpA family protein disulfide reductase [Saprospiraceae bacterium]
MHLRHFIITILLTGMLFTCTGCSTQPPLSGNITVKAGWNPVVYLIQPRSFSEIAANYTGLVVDSAEIGSDGRFAFNSIPDAGAPTLYQLAMQPKGSRYANQLLDENPLLANYMPIILIPGVPLRLRADSDHFQASFELESASTTDSSGDLLNTDDNAALIALRNLRHAAFEEWKDYLMQAPDEEHLLEQENALRQFQAPLMAFADSTRSMLAALVATRWVSLQNDYERVPEFLYGQCQKWSAEYPDAPFAVQLCEKAKALPLLVGGILPDFSAPMSSGDTVALKTILGKTLTILDIWASWCVPCRRENKQVLAPLWAAHRKNGLQIIGYSIDSSEGAWRNAIAKDGAEWPHASHLTGDETPFMEALRISTIPANFILDGKGKVLAKNLHGEELKVFVEEYLKK